MRRVILPAVLIGGVLFGPTTFAQDYGRRYERDDRYRDSHGEYGTWDRGGNPVDRAMSDLRRAASFGAYDRHERSRVDHALRALSKFDDRLRRGKFDHHALDEAIENMDHLVRGRGLNSRARDMLARDVTMLRDFRASGYDRRGNDYRR